MRKLFILMAALISVSCISGRKSGARQTADDKTRKYDVYAFGWVGDGTSAGGTEGGREYKSVYWKNGVRTVIADAVGTPEGYAEFHATDMAFVDGRPVFLGRAYENGRDDFSYFTYEDGKFTDTGLNENLNEPRLLDAGGELVVVGWTSVTDKDGTMNLRPLAWTKDRGTEIYDLNGFKCNEINGAVADNGNIYVCGRVYRGSFNDYDGYGAVWKNGEISVFRAPDNGKTMFGFTAITVSGGNTYALMHSQDDVPPSATRLTVWKNGNPLMTIDTDNPNATATCMAVDGDDIYVGGSANSTIPDDTGNSYGMPAIWKNGKAMDMDRAGVFGWINSIAVADGKVYATGNAGFKGAVWADGKCAVQKGANGENTVAKVFCVPARR